MLKVCSTAPPAILLTAAGSLTAISKSVKRRSKRLRVNKSRVFSGRSPRVLIPSSACLTGSSVGGLRRVGQQSEEPSRLPAGRGRAPEPGHTEPTLAPADGCHRSSLHHGPGSRLLLLIRILYILVVHTKGANPDSQSSEKSVTFAQLPYAVNISIIYYHYRLCLSHYYRCHYCALLEDLLLTPCSLLFKAR